MALPAVPCRHARATGTFLASSLLFVTATTLLGCVDLAVAVLPTGELRLAGGGTAYAAPAWFGLQLPEEEEAKYLPLKVPKGASDGCGEVTVDDPPADGGGFVLMVERGNCFFDVKALAAQEAGAEGLVVMNSVEGIYQVGCAVFLVSHYDVVGCRQKNSYYSCMRSTWYHTTGEYHFRNQLCANSSTVNQHLTRTF